MLFGPIFQPGVRLRSWSWKCFVNHVQHFC